MSSPRLRAPIVLAHGLFGFVRLGIGPWTLWSYFRGIPEFLRAGGNRVLAERVHPTAGIARRAEVLGRRIDAAFPGEPVHLIGHSMGGLDARQLAADPAWAGRVLSITTIGTPHLGSALADAAKRRMGPVYRLLERLKLDHRAFHDLTCELAREWSFDTPAPPGVPCFSVAGDPPHDAVCWPLRRLHRVLLDWEGPNDGLVSVASSEAFGTPLPAWPLDHCRQLNWMTGGRPHELPPALKAGYVAVLEDLARVESATPASAPAPAPREAATA